MRRSVCKNLCLMLMLTATPTWAADKGEENVEQARLHLQEKMQKLGVKSEEVNERVQHMTAAEIQEAEQKIDQATAGKDTITISVGTILLIILLILLL